MLISVCRRSQSLYALALEADADISIMFHETGQATMIAPGGVIRHLTTDEKNVIERLFELSNDSSHEARMP